MTHKESFVKSQSTICQSDGKFLLCYSCSYIKKFSDVDETLRLVQAFQYVDKHGEVCPAGWKPGKDTIIPNPTDKINYFSKQDEL